MAYYFNKTIDKSFDEALEHVTAVLKEQGFGIISEIDVQATMQEKLGEKFRPYKILGACNPNYAFQALRAEDKIGTMLPCNVIVQQQEDGVQVAAVDPVASMQAVENKELDSVAKIIQQRLKLAIDML